MGVIGRCGLQAKTIELLVAAAWPVSISTRFFPVLSFQAGIHVHGGCDEDEFDAMAEKMTAKGYAVHLPDITGDRGVRSTLPPRMPSRFMVI